MTRYLMIMLMAFVFVIGSGCDSAVSSMEAEGASVLDARLGISAMKLLPGNKAREDSEMGFAASEGSVVSGTVEEVDVDRIRVQGIDYFVTAQTVLVDLQDAPVPLASLTPGSSVKIEALQRSDGSWEALYVVVASLAPPPSGNRSVGAEAR